MYLDIIEKNLLPSTKMIKKVGPFSKTVIPNTQQGNFQLISEKENKVGKMA